MLRGDVVQAVKDKRFRVFAVSSVDEAVQVLTGVPAGEPLKRGGFTKNSVNARVEARFVALSEIKREFGGKSDEGDKGHGDGD